jgi:hypothetical protein
MNATMPGTTTDREGEDDNPAFDCLTRIYRSLGLEWKPASDAALADIACGWRWSEYPD